MRKSALLGAVVFILCMPAAAAEPSQKAVAPTADGARPANALLAKFFADYDAAQLNMSPINKGYRGIKDADYSKLDDQSDAAAARQNEAMLAAVEEMKARFDFAALNAQDQLSYRLFARLISRKSGAFQFRHDQYAFEPIGGIHAQLPAFLINGHPIATVADGEAYVSRLAALGVALEQQIKVAQDRAANGVSPPKWVYPQIIAVSRNVIKGAPFDDGGDSPLWADFKGKVEKLPAAPDQKNALLAAGRAALLSSVLPAYRHLIVVMQAEEATASDDDGVWRFADGKAYYAERLAYYTTTDLTPEQIHERGLRDVEQIHEEMRALMKRVAFKGDLPSFFAFMRGNPRFTEPNTEAGRRVVMERTEQARATVTAKLGQWFITLPKQPLQVRAVEPFREKSADAAFYEPASMDGSRPGIYYLNLSNLSDLPLNHLEVLFYHEGLPGHHLQYSIQTQIQNLPPFRRYGGDTVYLEGWGLYAEQLAKEMGQYQDPYSDFGRLELKLRRAIRLVVDTGIHCGTYRWSRAQAIDYILANTPDSRGAAEAAVNRYIVGPGQATAYMIGMDKIMDLRARARAALGTRFDIRQFHEVVLRGGSMPLDELEAQVNAWIASQSTSGATIGAAPKS